MVVPAASAQLAAFALIVCQVHPSSIVFDNYDCKYGGVSEEEGLPFVTEFEYLLDELVEAIWSWVVTCVSMLCAYASAHLSHSHAVALQVLSKSRRERLEHDQQSRRPNQL
jgi:hypothetical protein